MNALAQSLLGVAKGYLGPAAQQFLSAELHALGVNANSVTADDVVNLSARVRDRAERLMGAQKASELAEALARCHGPVPANASAHKLATDAAQKLFVSGKLRQAEKAFTDLLEKHGDVETYAGLARTQVALEDETAALNTLRDGASRFARGGDRATAVSLLAEAVALVPGDLSAHRRLAAALANQDDMPGAVEEYARFVDVALSSGDSRRALLELAYGRETLGDLPGLLALVDRVTDSHSRIDAPRPASRQAPLAHHSPAPSSHPVPPTSTLRVEGTRETSATPPANTAQHAKPAQDTSAQPIAAQPKPMPSKPVVAQETPAVVRPSAPLLARTRPNVSDTAVVLNGASTITHAQQAGDAPVDVLARTGVARRVKRAERPALTLEQQLSALPPMASGVEGAAIAASRAALFTSARDPRASEAVIDAARRLLALGKLQSASDVLLDFIGHGFTDREAQRLLIEVDCALGRRDVAKEKCNLLSQAYRLDGRGDVADDVERLARIL
jgi:tetratricopeptide (TPR) repeat protein